MKDPNNKDKANKPDLAAEIRRERKFSLTEAVAREAGGSLKGASPVARTQQMLMQIEEILDRKLPDNEGSLIRTIIARLEGNPPLLARHFERPEAALLEFLSGLLDSPANLEILVRQADARWGRDYDERPHFERDGTPPHPDDPYTRAGVRALLQILQKSLAQTQSNQN